MQTRMRMTILGYLGNDPVTRATASGQEVTTVSVAHSTGTDANRRTTWVNLSIWGERGKAFAKVCRKGFGMYVEGDFSARTYKDGAGNMKQSLDLTVDNWSILSSPEATGTATTATETLSDEEADLAPPV